MTPDEIKIDNQRIIDNYIKGILKDIFREGFTLGKIDKEILDIDDSLKVRDLFEKKTKQLREIFCYEN